MLRFIACVVCKHFNLFGNNNSKVKTYELWGIKYWFYIFL